MTKLALVDLNNLQNETSAVNTINTNSARIEVAMENTLSRDGTSPNEMNADLDMNNHRIYNLPAPVDTTEPLRKADADEILSLVDEFQEAIDATQGAVDAYTSIQALYLGNHTTLPATDNLGNPLQEGAMVSLVDQIDPDDDGLYVWHNSSWGPVGVLPAAFERVENILATNGQTIVPVPGGYSVGTTKVYRNGVYQRIGTNLGAAVGSDDVSATDGINLVFPSGVLQANDLITALISKSFSIVNPIFANEIVNTPSGTISAINVQDALNELATDATFFAPKASPVFTGNPTAPTPAPGDNDTSIATTAFVTSAIAAIPPAAAVPLPPGYLKGFGLTWASASTITFASGTARNDADTTNIIGAVGYTKAINASWVAGSGGGLRSGLVTTGNTWYYCFAICMPDGTSVDFIFDTSPTSPTLSSTGGRTVFRRIGAIRTDVSGNILQFLQNGDNFSWTTPSIDLNSATVSADQAVTLLVPPIAGVKAHLQGLVSNATNTPGVWIRRVGQGVDGNIPTAKVAVSGGAFYGYHTEVVVDSLGQITVSANNANTTVIVGTYAYDDHRGRI